MKHSTVVRHVSGFGSTNACDACNTGWNLDLRIRTEQAVACVEQAVLEREIAPGVLTLGTYNGNDRLNLDSSPRKTSANTSRRVVSRTGAAATAIPSPRRSSNSWFGQFTKRVAWRREWEAIDQARRDIADDVGVYHHRPHSGIAYRTPAPKSPPPGATSTNQRPETVYQNRVHVRRPQLLQPPSDLIAQRTRAELARLRPTRLALRSLMSGPRRVPIPTTVGSNLATDRQRSASQPLRYRRQRIADLDAHENLFSISDPKTTRPRLRRVGNPGREQLVAHHQCDHLRSAANLAGDIHEAQSARSKSERKLFLPVSENAGHDDVHVIEGPESSQDQCDHRWIPPPQNSIVIGGIRSQNNYRLESRYRVETTRSTRDHRPTGCS